MANTDEVAHAVYIISVVNYDEYLIRFATLSREKSLELFEVVRKECMDEAEDSIKFCDEEGLSDDNRCWADDYRKELLQYKDDLSKMKPGDIIRGDRPNIDKIALV